MLPKSGLPSATYDVCGDTSSRVLNALRVEYIAVLGLVLCRRYLVSVLAFQHKGRWIFSFVADIGKRPFVTERGTRVLVLRVTVKQEQFQPAEVVLTDQAICSTGSL